MCASRDSDGTGDTWGTGQTRRGQEKDGCNLCGKRSLEALLWYRRLWFWACVCYLRGSYATPARICQHTQNIQATDCLGNWTQ